jgi:hypothetical protein
MWTWTSYSSSSSASLICIGIPKSEQSLRLDLPPSYTQFTNPTLSTISITIIPTSPATPLPDPALPSV